MCVCVCVCVCVCACVRVSKWRSIKYMRCRSKRGRCQACSVVPLLLTQTGTPDMFVCSQMLSQTELFKIYTMLEELSSRSV